MGKMGNPRQEEEQQQLQEQEEEQDGLSVHSPCHAPPSSASSLPKELPQVELELRILEALEFYPPVKLQALTGASVEEVSKISGLQYPTILIQKGWVQIRVDSVYKKLVYEDTWVEPTGIHRHFVIFGLMEYLRRSLDRHFSPDEILQLLDRFYNLEMLKPDEDDMEILSQEEEFSLPQGFSLKDE